MPLPLALQGRADEIALMPVPDHFRTGSSAEGAEGGDEINGFENVGLALGVVAEQQMKAGREIRVQAGVITKVPQA